MYLWDGTKLCAKDSQGNGLVYLGSLVYDKRGDSLTLESASFGEGRIAARQTADGVDYSMLAFQTDHLGSVRGVVDSGEILEHNDYDPFGRRQDAPDAEISDNRYRYNGKEEQAFVGNPYQDYGARMYDSQWRMRWNTMDPMAEKYYSISPYAFCANNPIKFVDPNGAEFTQAAWDWINKLISQINSMQANNKTKIAEKQARLSTGDFSQKLAKRLGRQIDRLNNANSALEATRGEITTMAASSQVYDVKVDNSLNTSDMTVGVFTFNFSNGNAEIRMPGNGDMGLFAHELKHAYQFETGGLSIGPRMLNDAHGSANFLYDKYDEVAAYNRGALFGQTSYSTNNLPSVYSNLPTGPIDAASHPGLANINSLPLVQRVVAYQQIANSTRHAFRVSGQTYFRPR